MTQRAVAPVVAAGLAALGTLAVLAAPAAGRRHHPHRPPRALPHSLAVDEKEWAVQPSQKLVSAGSVTIRGYDRGQDPHNLQLTGPSGPIQTISLTPGASGTIVANLRPGTYRLVCTLYAGTPQSHEALGMHATITVR
jgi:plastocyanin